MFAWKARSWTKLLVSPYGVFRWISSEGPDEIFETANRHVGGIPEVEIHCFFYSRQMSNSRS
jgi:hypothetical protein